MAARSRTGSPDWPCSTRSARPPYDAQLQTWAALRANAPKPAASPKSSAEQAVVNVGEADAADELVPRWVEMAGDVGPDGFLRQLSVQASRPDARPYVGGIDVPTLVLSGSTDTVCPPPIQAELAAAIPGAEHVTIDGAGHMSLLDHPAEVTVALERWLA